MKYISDLLQSFRVRIPSEMARQPRRLDEVKRWKATEFRQFLLYTGIVVLRGVLHDRYYSNFLALTVAARIMLDDNQQFRNDHLEYANKLTRYFVRKSRELYGPTFATYNVHSLIHLHEDVAHFDANLDRISCFPFENYLQVIKKYVRQSQSPVTQVVKRVWQLENSGGTDSHKIIKTKITTNCRDSYFLLKSGDIACIKDNIDADTYLCGIVKEHQIECYFNEPCDSRLVNIYFVSQTSMRMNRRIIKRSDLKRKVVYLPVNDGVVFVTLLNDIE